MAAATLVSDLALGFAGKIGHAVETGKFEEWSDDDIETAIAACLFFRDLFARLRHSIEAALRQGIDARTFAMKYENAVAELDLIRETVGQVVARARVSHLPARAEEFISS